MLKLSKSNKFVGFFIYISVLIFMFSICINTTLCKSVADNEGSPRIYANFDSSFDVTNIEIDYNVLPSDANENITSKLSAKSIEAIEKVAKNTFNSNYEVQSLILYRIYSTESGSKVRLTDFSHLQSIEITATYDGDNANTANDAYCAVFVNLTESQEENVLAGDYSIFESVGAEYVAKSVDVTAVEGTSNELLLTIQNDNSFKDGFMFLLSMGDNENNMGTIVMVVGIVISVLLVILIIWTFRSYIVEKRRKNYAKNVQGISDLTDKLKSKNVGFSNYEKKSKDNLVTNNNTTNKSLPNKPNINATKPSSSSLPNMPKMPNVNTPAKPKPVVPPKINNQNLSNQNNENKDSSNQ